MDEKERKIVRESYEYGQILGNVAASCYPDGDCVNLREEVHWQAKKLRDDPTEAAEIVPLDEYGIQQGVLDRVLGGEHRYEL
ncbi:hypothetical protein JMJ58_00725 [Haloterrigena salifodinae]|uniref:Uncharacterized protein n=1 Tax=Haloterrigena salifodinae TaxID=2675099 RepID=A0A8T8E132_9EURY|nr:hypothetical protein [Haloterrigena salifodinae]QRV15459.1 hypothetical protein JMJ58_00725 [Haloterrigena salifodinae]